jgi:hypothetical protein
MNKLLITLSLLVLEILNPLSSAAEEDETKTAKFGPFSVSYPSEGWEVQKLPPPPGKGSTMFGLVANGDQKVSIILTDMAETEEMIKKQRELGSAEMARAFALPMAVEMSKRDQSKVFYSVGVMELIDSTEPSVRFLVVNPTNGKSTSIDAFTYFPDNAPGHLLLGAITTQVSQNPDDWKSIDTDIVAEAYEIMRSVEVIDKK